MTIELQRRGDVCVLGLSGEVMLGQPTTLLREKVQEVIAGGERKLVLDMLGVPWLDSSGIGEVFACYKRARAEGGSIKLVLQGKSRSLFTFTELHRILEIHDDLEAAVADYGRGAGAESGPDRGATGERR